MDNVRAVALSVLNKCVSAEQYSNLALDTALERSDLKDADRGLLTVLVYGVLEKQITLDHWICSLSSRPVNEIDLATRNLLRMGLYQLAFLDRIPDHAAVNETVALASKRTKGFVNAILRAFLRADKSIALPDQKKDPVTYLSVKYSFSPSICACFLERFGEERTEGLFDAFGKKPPVTIRTNTLLTTREELMERMLEKGLSAKETPESAVGICLDGIPVTAAYGFREGLFFVQDEASQLCVEALDAREGMKVLDVCACPGSKSFGAAIDMNNRGRVISCDLHGNKLSLVRSGAERLGIEIVETVARDARDFCADWESGFDRVLCDVPCSGFGVFAKKPELRYKDVEKSRGLPKIQRDILENACRYVKDGGLLVYSTCTLLPEENEDNVSAFLEAHSDFSCLRMRTLYPDVDGCDGFFFAVLQKNEKDA
jgi:16S rRNA (cytosine967-C5)-methyltransferase